MVGFRAVSGWWWPIGLIAITVALIPVRSPWKISGHWCWLAVGSLAFFAWAPTTVRIGLAIAAVAGVCGGIGTFGQKRFPGVGRVAGLAAALCVAWFAGAFAQACYMHIDARLDHYPALALPLYLALRLLGQPAQWTDGMVYIRTEAQVTAVLPSPDKFGGEFVLILVAALTVLAILYQVSVKRILLLWLTLAVFATLRAAAAVTFVIHNESTALWGNDYVTITAFLPILFFLPTLFRPSANLVASVCTEHTDAIKPTRKTGQHRQSLPHIAFLTILVCIGTALIVGGWRYVEPGVRKTGTVVVDESHSRWEWSEHPLGTKYFGRKSVYHYYNMVEALSHYYTVRRNFEAITDESLKNVSVLILKTPTHAYDQETRDAIGRFIARGGGVWCIGDHTDAFGMDTYLNSVLAPYGLYLRPDSLMEPGPGRNLWQGDASAHPIAKRMGMFLYYTGCSVHSDWGTPDVVTLGRVHRDAASYALGTFFGDFAIGQDEQTGYSTSAVAVPRGLGRIAIWDDSTLFSNFSIFMPGKTEMAIQTVDWLNRREPDVPRRPFLIVAGMLCVLAGLSLAHRARIGLSPIITLGVAWGVGLGFAGASSGYEFAYPTPSPVKPFRLAAFYEPEFTDHLPVAAPLDDVTDTGYLSSFIAAQRVGRRPYVATNLTDALKAPVIIICHAHFSIPPADRARLQAWVRAGGHLVLLDAGTGGTTSDIAHLMSEVGFNLTELPTHDDSTQLPLAMTSSINGVGPGSVDSTSFVKQATNPQSTDEFTVSDAFGKDIGKMTVRLRIDGGKSLAMARVAKTKTANNSVGPNAFPVFTGKQVGAGYVFASGTVSAFADTGLGDSEGSPTPLQYRRLEWLFALLR